MKFDGFVLTHGTDTLAYTAALLTHLLPHFDKPLVLTGSMLPMGVPDSDAPRNLLDAFRTAADGRAGVYAVMNGQILHGSHVFKQHSTEIDAFLSANAAPAGEIRESEVHWNTPASVSSGEPKLVEQIDTHILPVRLSPDLDPSFFSVLLGYPKVVLEAFGAGGVPARLESAVRDLIQSGTRVYITTSARKAVCTCTNTRSDAVPKHSVRFLSAAVPSRTRSAHSCAVNCKIFCPQSTIKSEYPAV